MCHRLWPVGFILLAFGAGALLALVFPAYILVFVLALVAVGAGLLLIKR